MSQEPPHQDPSEDRPMTSPWAARRPPGQQDDVVEFGGLGRSDRPRRLAIGAAVAVVAMLGGAGVAYAASGSGSAPSSTAAAGSSPSPSASAPTQRPFTCPKSVKHCPPFGRMPFRHFGFPGGGPGGFPFGIGGALHGSFVTGKSGGGYQTVDVQRGKVTAVSSSSLTVKSADGFSATYAIGGSTIIDAQRDGIGSVKSGNQVYVTATVSGSKTTATNVSDLTLLGHGQVSFGFGGYPSR
jgi:hypothetical protein